jgi:K+ transporter
MTRSAAANTTPLPLAAMTALGVVYGDLGASPLYALQTVVHALGGRVSAEAALGSLLLIVWTLIIIVSVKYCLLVMRADNRGEGGNIWRVTLRFGFVEDPNLPAALARVKHLDCRADLSDAVYFAARDLVVGKPGGRLRGGPLKLFAWLYRNAVKAEDRFSLPPKDVIEIAREIEV